MSKELTLWIIPGRVHPQTEQTLSPQYLFPPNPQNTVAENSKFSKQGVISAYDHLVGQKLSPQYLFPPNFRDEPLSEINAVHHWAVAALIAHLKKKQIELKPWSLISLLDRLRYCQRPPFIFPGRTNIIFYRLNLLGTVA